jgi:hypothetical protein
VRVLWCSVIGALVLGALVIGDRETVGPRGVLGPLADRSARAHSDLLSRNVRLEPDHAVANGQVRLKPDTTPESETLPAFGFVVLVASGLSRTTVSRTGTFG